MNADLQICRENGKMFRELIPYALKTLSLPNVVLYIDAGSGASLGWPGNLKAGSAEIAGMYKAAGSPSQVRGFAANVAGWNSW
jgi:cellulose 1,4-beta-cellobiosidase